MIAPIDILSRQQKEQFIGLLAAAAFAFQSDTKMPKKQDDTEKNMQTMAAGLILKRLVDKLESDQTHACSLSFIEGKFNEAVIKFKSDIKTPALAASMNEAAVLGLSKVIKDYFEIIRAEDRGKDRGVK